MRAILPRKYLAPFIAALATIAMLLAVNSLPAAQAQSLSAPATTGNISIVNAVQTMTGAGAGTNASNAYLAAGDHIYFRIAVNRTPKPAVVTDAMSSGTYFYFKYAHGEGTAAPNNSPQKAVLHGIHHDVALQKWILTFRHTVPAGLSSEPGGRLYYTTDTAPAVHDDLESCDDQGANCAKFAFTAIANHTVIDNRVWAAAGGAWTASGRTAGDKPSSNMANDVSIINAPGDGVYRAGDVIAFRAAYSGRLAPLGASTPNIGDHKLNIRIGPNAADGDTERRAALVRVDNSGDKGYADYEYTVQADDKTDVDGIRIMSRVTILTGNTPTFCPEVIGHGCAAQSVSIVGTNSPPVITGVSVHPKTITWTAGATRNNTLNFQTKRYQEHVTIGTAGDGMHYRAAPLPEGLTVTNAGGPLSIGGTPQNTGTTSWTVTAYDGLGSSASKTVTINVVQPSAPVFASAVGSMTVYADDHRASHGGNGRGELALPAATGGTGKITYLLINQPDKQGVHWFERVRQNPGDNTEPGVIRVKSNADVNGGEVAYLRHHAHDEDDRQIHQDFTISIVARPMPGTATVSGDRLGFWFAGEKILFDVPVSNGPVTVDTSSPPKLKFEIGYLDNTRHELEAAYTATGSTASNLRFEYTVGNGVTAPVANYKSYASTGGLPYLKVKGGITNLSSVTSTVNGVKHAMAQLADSDDNHLTGKNGIHTDPRPGLADATSAITLWRDAGSYTLESPAAGGTFTDITLSVLHNGNALPATAPETANAANAWGMTFNPLTRILSWTPGNTPGTETAVTLKYRAALPASYAAGSNPVPVAEQTVTATFKQRPLPTAVNVTLPAGKTVLASGDEVIITVDFDQPVTVKAGGNAPTINLQIGDNTRTAAISVVPDADAPDSGENGKDPPKQTGSGRKPAVDTATAASGTRVTATYSVQGPDADKDADGLSVPANYLGNAEYLIGGPTAPQTYKNNPVRSNLPASVAVTIPAHRINEGAAPAPAEAIQVSGDENGQWFKGEKIIFEFDVSNGPVTVADGTTAPKLKFEMGHHGTEGATMRQLEADYTGQASGVNRLRFEYTVGDDYDASWRNRTSIGSPRLLVKSVTNLTSITNAIGKAITQIPDNATSVNHLASRSVNAETRPFFNNATLALNVWRDAESATPADRNRSGVVATLVVLHNGTALPATAPATATAANAWGMTYDPATDTLGWQEGNVADKTVVTLTRQLKAPAVYDRNNVAPVTSEQTLTVTFGARTLLAPTFPADALSSVTVWNTPAGSVTLPAATSSQGKAITYRLMRDTENTQLPKDLWRDTTRTSVVPVPATAAPNSVDGLAFNPATRVLSWTESVKPDDDYPHTYLLVASVAAGVEADKEISVQFNNRYKAASVNAALSTDQDSDGVADIGDVITVTALFDTNNYSLALKDSGPAPQIRIRIGEATRSVAANLARSRELTTAERNAGAAELPYDRLTAAYSITAADYDRDGVSLPADWLANAGSLVGAASTPYAGHATRYDSVAAFDSATGAIKVNPDRFGWLTSATNYPVTIISNRNYLAGASYISSVALPDVSLGRHERNAGEYLYNTAQNNNWPDGIRADSTVSNGRMSGQLTGKFTDAARTTDEIRNVTIRAIGQSNGSAPLETDDLTMAVAILPDVELEPGDKAAVNDNYHYGTGETLRIIVRHNQAVDFADAGTKPTLSLTINGNSRTATYSIAASDPDAGNHIFEYAVQSGDIDADGGSCQVTGSANAGAIAPAMPSDGTAVTLKGCRIKPTPPTFSNAVGPTNTGPNIVVDWISDNNQQGWNAGHAAAYPLGVTASGVRVVYSVENLPPNVDVSNESTNNAIVIAGTGNDPSIRILSPNERTAATRNANPVPVFGAGTSRHALVATDDSGQASRLTFTVEALVGLQHPIGATLPNGATASPANSDNVPTGTKDGQPAYQAGDRIVIETRYERGNTVKVTGENGTKPHIAFTIGGESRKAYAVVTNAARTLRYVYTVAAGDNGAIVITGRNVQECEGLTEYRNGFAYRDMHRVTRNPCPLPAVAAQLTAPANAPANAPIVYGDLDSDDDGLIDITHPNQLALMMLFPDGTGLLSDNRGGLSAEYQADPHAARRETLHIGANAPYAKIPNGFPVVPPGSNGCPNNLCHGYELMNDIDMTGLHATAADLLLPRADGLNAINGKWETVLDGKGYVIRNLNIDLPAAGSGSDKDAPVGFFNYIGAKGVVRNLGFINATVKGSDSYGDGDAAGVIAGISSGIIENVYVRNGNASGAAGAGLVIGQLGFNASQPGGILRNFWATAAAGDSSDAAVSISRGSISNGWTDVFTNAGLPDTGDRVTPIARTNLGAISQVGEIHSTETGDWSDYLITEANLKAATFGAGWDNGDNCQKPILNLGSHAVANQNQDAACSQ